VHVYHHYRPTLRRHTAVHYNYVCCGSGTRHGHWRGYRRWW
jgi:hypothetical protein